MRYATVIKIVSIFGEFNHHFFFKCSILSSAHDLIILLDLTIYKLFATRADLYRTVYTHAKVKV